MKFKNLSFKSFENLCQHIGSHEPTLFLGSQTSTVIPYGFLQENLTGKGLESEVFYIADLSQMPVTMEMIEGSHLRLRGGVSWQMASHFLQEHNRVIKTYPTENLAQICAGVATSCTGERCFGFGSLRDQVVSLKYVGFDGEERPLCRQKNLKFKKEIEPVLKKYRQDFDNYKELKNAPFPRFEKETDLMIGTEGQLGVVTEVVLETAPQEELQYLFIRIPRWEKDFKPHLEIFDSVQKQRHRIYSCELTDYNSMVALEQEKRLFEANEEFDIIFLEIPISQFEGVYEEIIAHWSLIDEKCIFEISEEKFKRVRAAIPRTLFERNSVRGILKKGTDVQLRAGKFSQLLEFYRDWTNKGVEYNLFGHFGDAHLHFNFMPQKGQQKECDKYLMELYSKVKDWQGSPFAEHGIGLLKQPFIERFYSAHQYDLFSYLKNEYDPYNQFFPQGFMNL